MCTTTSLWIFRVVDITDTHYDLTCIFYVFRVILAKLLLTKYYYLQYIIDVHETGHRVLNKRQEVCNKITIIIYYLRPGWVSCKSCEGESRGIKCAFNRSIRTAANVIGWTEETENKTTDKKLRYTRVTLLNAGAL